MFRYLPMLLLILCSAVGAQELRQALSLNGVWEAARVDSLGAGPGDAEWTDQVVPGTLPGGTGQAAWLRTRFHAPELPPGSRALLYFGGVKYNSEVRLNGIEVGGEFNGYDPFTLDVTDALVGGGENELLLGCRDWTGIFSREVDLSPYATNWTVMRGMADDAVLGPIGGLYASFGPWDDVELRIVPETRVEHVAITTSVREGSIGVDYELIGADVETRPLTLETRVLDGDEAVLDLPGATIAGGEGDPLVATVTADWPDARYWSHEDPYLYQLETTLRADGEVVDRVRTRFGFRELWIEGPDFYLNGSRIQLLASSSWPVDQRYASREDVREFWEALKAGNVVAFRTHTQPWRRQFYEVADEVGILVIPEGAIWNDDTSYRVNDPEFWENYATHLERMTRQYRNNPSVVMYSLCNEFHGAELNLENEYATGMLAEMGHRMKDWDPTRPITYESDGDPLGAADVIGIHYPHEYPDYTQYPNTAWWIDG
ncbi:MAG: hypothetical protein GF320_15245, partial [Armatimonadia bacterium]|nr:hypothetical protein [Armatimonadia bacterium]